MKLKAVKSKQRVISQATLAKYVELKKAEATLELLKTQIIDDLTAGAIIQDGPLVAHLDIGSRAVVAWRVEFVKVRSEAEAVSITEKAPKSVVHKLKVFDRLVDAQ